jgi:hypothetical protein
MEVATWLFMVAFAYAVGVFWYDLLPGRVTGKTWRVAAYPFAVMVLAEAFVPLGPKFLGFHPGSAVIAALIGVIIDWLVTTLRHPKMAETLEMQTAAAKA